MSEADREIQAAARALADELVPHEVEAELAGGELPDGLLEAHRRRVAELGFEAINMPKELGGGRLHDLPAGAGLRADRPGDQRARLGGPHPGVLAARGGT